MTVIKQISTFVLLPTFLILSKNLFLKFLNIFYLIFPRIGHLHITLSGIFSHLEFLFCFLHSIFWTLNKPFSWNTDCDCSYLLHFLLSFYFPFPLDLTTFCKSALHLNPALPHNNKKNEAKEGLWYSKITNLIWIPITYLSKIDGIVYVIIQEI